LPEGDSIFRAARTLNRALAGRQVVRFESVLPALTRVHEDHPLTGRTIESVTAAGKHLLMRFSGGLVLRTHMRMNGSWHIYRPGETWQRPRRDMRIVVATDAFEAVGFNVPVAEWLDGKSMARQEDLRGLGPDLLGDAFDEDEAIRRFHERGTTEIADALLNQRVVAGAGNIYKSEVLFICGVNPFAPVAALGEDTLRQIVRIAQKYMRANVTDPRGGIVTYRGYGRTTGRGNPGERLYVYGRARQPCRKCGSAIRVRPQGGNARLTYWCPTCQP
jgi:endonuclease VIII